MVALGRGGVSDERGIPVLTCIATQVYELVKLLFLLLFSRYKS